MVNTILKEADLFCPNSVRINFTIYLTSNCFYFPINTNSRTFGHRQTMTNAIFTNKKCVADLN
ncbi:hypothetical protein BIS21_02700 [Lactiplantibacillus plantarum]|nr:hypothetical protein BIS21_02700 [Lactiplantibacillus plantarum]